MIYFSWNPGWNFLRWMNWIFLFQFCLDRWMWIIRLAVFCNQRTTRRKICFSYIYAQEKYELMEHVVWRGLVSHNECYPDYPIWPFIHIIVRMFLWSFIMTIMLMFTIRFRLIMRYMLWSKIIIGDTECFMRTPLTLWIIFIGEVWLMLYKCPQNIKQLIKMVRNQYIYFACCWYTCVKKMTLPINEYFLFNAGLLTIIWIS